MAVATLEEDKHLLAFIEQWVDLLAAHDFEQAASLLAPLPDRDPLTAAELEQMIESYGRGPVTGRRHAHGDGPRFQVYRLRSDPGSGEAEYDLPIGDSWSDLTAIFNFRNEEGGTAISLRDIHVL